MNAIFEETNKHYSEEDGGEDIPEQDLSSKGEVEVSGVGGVSEEGVDSVGDQLMSYYLPKPH